MVCLALLLPPGVDPQCVSRFTCLHRLLYFHHLVLGCRQHVQPLLAAFSEAILASHVLSSALPSLSCVLIALPPAAATQLFSTLEGLPLCNDRDKPAILVPLHNIVSAPLATLVVLIHSCFRRCTRLHLKPLWRHPALYTFCPRVPNAC